MLIRTSEPLPKARHNRGRVAALLALVLFFSLPFAFVVYTAQSYEAAMGLELGDYYVFSGRTKRDDDIPQSQNGPMGTWTREMAFPLSGSDSYAFCLTRRVPISEYYH